MQTSVVEEAKITITLQSNQDKISIAVPTDCTIRDIADVFRGSQNLNANVKLELYKENMAEAMNDNATVGEVGLKDGDVVVIKKKFTGA